MRTGIAYRTPSRSTMPASTPVTSRLAEPGARRSRIAASPAFMATSTPRGRGGSPSCRRSCRGSGGAFTPVGDGGFSMERGRLTTGAIRPLCAGERGAIPRGSPERAGPCRTSSRPLRPGRRRCEKCRSLASSAVWHRGDRQSRGWVRGRSACRLPSGS